nr:MAG TPA_asm: hypothetical protein [Caudoviricetes sp.]
MKPRTRRPRKASPAQREEALRRRLEDRNAEMEDRYYSEQQKWVQRLNTATTRADKDEAVARLHELNEWFNHIRTRRSQAEIEANLRRAARNEEAAKKWQAILARERKQYERELREIAREERRVNREASQVATSAMRNPYKTWDRRDERQYQTHGVRNPRAKREPLKEN